MNDQWVETTLGAVADWSAGGTPKATSRSFYDGGDIPWAIISDIQNGPLKETANCITQAGLDAIGGTKKMVPEGAVLVSMYGSVGRSAIARIPMATNQAIARGVVGNQVSAEYLFLWMNAHEGHLDQLARGATQRNINKQIITAFPIALPPAQVQERIVEVISAVDDQITALDVEAGALSLVLRRRRADHMTDESAEPVRAEHAFDFSTGVRRTPDRASGPYMTPYLRSANVGYGTLDLSDVLEMNYDPAEREKFGLRYGDVLVSEGSASANAVGMPAMWRDELPAPVCTQMTLLRLRALEGVCIPEFVFHWSMWAYESRAFLDVAGGTNIKHISAKRAKGMAVHLPSLDRQREMAVELDAMESALQATRAEAARLREVRAALLSGLLDRTINIESAEI